MLARFSKPRIEEEARLVDELEAMNAEEAKPAE
jgi:hypothetical protein